jgi:hypothetical protein
MQLSPNICLISRGNLKTTLCSNIMASRFSTNKESKDHENHMMVKDGQEIQVRLYAKKKCLSLPRHSESLKPLFELLCNNILSS